MSLNKPIKDVTDLNKAFNDLSKKTNLLQRRFLAVAMDYKHYIDNSWEQEEIYDLRDNVQYRFFSAQLHLELMIRQHFVIEERFEELFKKDPKYIFGEYYPVNPHFENAEKEISVLFDSIIYHLTSIFDYMSRLTAFICGKNNEEKLKWTNLVRSALDPNNHYGKLKIAAIIREQNKNFADKLYEHRSFLIHEKGDLNRYTINVELSEKESKFYPNFLTSVKFNKRFSELRKMSESEYLTVKFVGFWLCEKCIDSVTELLFGLKYEMENNRKVPFGMFGYADPKTNILMPVSTIYWKEALEKEE